MYKKIEVIIVLYLKSIKYNDEKLNSWYFCFEEFE